MFDFLKKLFGGSDDARRHEMEVNDAARKIEMDEPMAGAGAQLSGQRDTSETARNLERGD